MNEHTVPTSEVVVLDRTRAWLRDNFLYARAEVTLRDEDPLLSGGVIDSMGVIELVEFLQESFAIAIADHEITEDNLGSLRAIARFVFAKCQPTTGAQASSRHVA